MKREFIGAYYWSLPRFRRMFASRLDDPCNASGFQGVMDTSPTLSIGGSRARAALLTTSGTGTGSTDRRVVFLASQPSVGSSHETKTWPHHWSPHTVCSSSAKAYGIIKWLIDKAPNRLNSKRLTEKYDWVEPDTLWRIHFLIIFRKLAIISYIFCVGICLLCIFSIIFRIAMLFNPYMISFQ